MTVKELVMVKEALCRSHQSNQCSEDCLLYECEDCRNIHNLNEYLTHEKEKELMDWFHKNVNTYINDFCKKFPKADREYIVGNVCCGCIYNGCDCDECDDFDGCSDHWNSIMENE